MNDHRKNSAPEVPVEEGYNRWASVYDDDGNPLIALEERVLMPLLGEVEDKEVADLGCGTGRRSLFLARRGAKVTALDGSEGHAEKGPGEGQK